MEEYEFIIIPSSHAVNWSYSEVDWNKLSINRSPHFFCDTDNNSYSGELKLLYFVFVLCHANV